MLNSFKPYTTLARTEQPVFGRSNSIQDILNQNSFHWIYKPIIYLFVPEIV